MYVVQQHVSTDPSLTGSVGISVGWRTPGVSGRSAPVPLFRKNPGPIPAADALHSKNRFDLTSTRMILEEFLRGSFEYSLNQIYF